MASSPTEETSVKNELTSTNKAVASKSSPDRHQSRATIGCQQKSLTDALNDIIPGVFEDMDTQPMIDHELIHSDLFRTAESLISSTIFSMCIDNLATEITRYLRLTYKRLFLVLDHHFASRR